MASDFTDGICEKVVQLVFEYLPRAYKNGANDPLAREKMHNASTLAGMAFANAFLGMDHAMAHKLGAKFHIPHGRICGILLPSVIRYNGTRPQKLATWPKYNYYQADEKYAHLAKILGLPCNSVEEGVESFAKAVGNLAKDLGVIMNFKDNGVDEKEYMSSIEELSYLAYEDQCSTVNPRVPMVLDMQNIMKHVYDTKEFIEK
jgi:acetaldehyde dehydrogenase/alcohol dehydrogenase